MVKLPPGWRQKTKVNFLVFYTHRDGWTAIEDVRKPAEWRFSIRIAGELVDTADSLPEV